MLSNPAETILLKLSVSFLRCSFLGLTPLWLVSRWRQPRLHRPLERLFQAERVKRQLSCFGGFSGFLVHVRHTHLIFLNPPKLLRDF